MTRSDYVQFKKDNAYFRRRVPTELVQVIGKKEWSQTLKTQDRRVAHQRAKILEGETDAEIQRAYRVLQGTPLNTDEIVTFGGTHFERTNAYLDTFTAGIDGSDDAILERLSERPPGRNGAQRGNGGQFPDLETAPELPPDAIRQGAEMRLASLIHSRAVGDYTLVQTFADAVFEGKGLARRVREPEDPGNLSGPQVEWLEIDRSRADYQALAKELLEREIAAVKRSLVQLQKAEMGWIDPPTQVFAPSPEAKAPIELRPDASKTPSQLLERFARDSREARGASTMRSFTTAINCLEQVTGTKPIAMITRNDVVECYELISSCPQKYKTRLKVATMREAIEKNQDGAIPVNSPATVQKHISHLRCFFDWARKRNLIATDPVGDLKVERGKKTASNDSKGYSADDLNKIYRLAPFVVPPDQRGYRFWVPLVALFTGSRMSEVCRLDVADVHSDGELWWFQIYSGKTKKKYPVPVHGELMKLGFLHHVQRRREDGGEKLFPDAPMGAVNRNAYQPVSQWFAYLLTKAGMKRAGVNVHAFRHTFITACRNSGIPKEMAMGLTGHKGDTVHDDYGDPHGVVIRNKAMKKLTFQGVSLSHLHVNTGEISPRT